MRSDYPTSRLRAQDSFCNHADLFLALLCRKRFEQRGRQMRVTFFNFFVAQRAFVGAILQPQSHRTF